jgi:uncharacterized protein YjbI with pentapeptide repeats
MCIIVKSRAGKVLVTVTSKNGVISFDAFLGRDLTGAVFDSLCLEGANFDDTCPLVDASFRGADLYWASFSFCNARCADFEGADLRGASFRDTDLRRCSFRGANLGMDNVGGRGTFERSDLRGADLSGTNLNGLRCKGAKYDSTTIFPTGFSPVDHAMAKVE